MSSERAVLGALVGCGLGVVVAMALAPSTSGGALGAPASAEEAAADAASRAAALLRRCEHLCLDKALCSTLSDPAALFVDLDAEGCGRLLASYDALLRLDLEARKGSKRGGLLADALRARREARKILAALVKRARQERPSQASDLSEDFAALGGCLDDYLHNISQDVSLNSLSSAAAF